MDTTSFLERATPSRSGRCARGNPIIRAVAVVILSLVGPVSVRAFDVTGCSQVVPPNETGVLQNDIAGCPSSAVGVFLDDRSELDLNGHVIDGGTIGVHCFGRHCAVRGPGEIRYAVRGVVATAPSARLLVEDVDVHHNAFGGIETDSGGKSRIVAQRVKARYNGVGIQTNFKGKVFGEDVDASFNRSDGIVAGSKFSFERLTILDTGVGYPVVYGKGLVNLYGGGRLIDSTITGSTYIDIDTVRRPRLIASTCGTSRSTRTGEAWGVCSND